MNRALFLTLALCACGGLPGAPTLGSTCAMDAPRECYSEKSFAFCDGGKWAEYACADRCSSATTPVCAQKAPTVGDACPASWEGLGACPASDLSFIATCKDRKWTRGFECGAKSCTRNEGNGLLECK